jgi:hypothetical protein
MQAADSEWDFDLEETVTLLWLINTTGLVIGRSQFMRKDDEYLVEYPDGVGRLTQTWVPGDAVDKVSMN